MRFLAGVCLFASILALSACGRAKPVPPPDTDDAPQSEIQTSDQVFEPFTLDYRHLTGIGCDVHDSELPCRNLGHFILDAGGKRAIEFGDLREILRREADRQRFAGNTRLSSREVVISGESGMPWGLIQELILLCSDEGIFRIGWHASEPHLESVILSGWLPHKVEAIPGSVLVSVTLGKDGRGIVRAVNGAVVDNDRMAARIRGALSDLGKSGRSPVRIIVEASPELPWSSVVGIVTLCQVNGWPRVEFASPVHSAALLRTSDGRSVAYFPPDQPEPDFARTKSGLGQSVGCRYPDRLRRGILVTRGGGTTGAGSTESAVTGGLRWLARHQCPDGHWWGERFEHLCAGAKCPDAGVQGFDEAQTGMALLAFLGAGYTHLTRETYIDPHTNRKMCWGVSIKDAIRWLITRQDKDGCFGDQASPAMLLNHAIASMAMTEAFGMTHAAIFRDPAQRGIDFLLRSLQVDAVRKDPAVAAWCVMTIHTAKVSGLQIGVTGQVLARGLADRVADDRIMKIGYTDRSTGRTFLPGLGSKWDRHPASAAAGLLCRALFDRDPKDSAPRTGVETLLRDLPAASLRKTDFRYWHFASLAFLQVDGPAGKAWRTWNGALKDALLSSQKFKRDGCKDGSWDAANDPWGLEGGRVYATAVNVMTLETYYRFERVLR